MSWLKKMFVALLFVASNASAVIPENGWWWASNESGRGFNIEVQNNLLFFASFAYDTSGNPLWLISGGPMTSDRDYSGDLTSFGSGQCFGCPYRPPVQTYQGRLTLRFTSSQTAVLTINGVSISVKRFDFWLNETAPDAMLGEFSFVIGARGDLFDAERIAFYSKQSNSSGVFLGGSRAGTSASVYPSVVSYSSSLGEWQILLDSSTSYYRWFRFNTTGFNRVEGYFWIYQKGSNPTGSGTFFQAFRTASAALIVNGAGPGSSKMVPDDVRRANRDAADARMSEVIGASVEGGNALSEPALKELRNLESALMTQKRAAQQNN